MGGVDRIRPQVRAKLERGVLPREKCLVTWFGPGAGFRCEVCDEPVTSQQIECECEHPRGHTIRMHQGCFVVWDAERQEPAPA